MLSNDAAGVCICDVNSAVAASPDRPGATPPRTLSDYFTVNSPRVLRHRGSSVLRASHFSAVLVLMPECGFTPSLRETITGGGQVSRERIAKDRIRYSRSRNISYVG